MINGSMAFAKELPPTGTFAWVDVRDLALAHVKAIETPAAANKRFFITAGHFSNKEVLEIIRREFPDLRSKLPAESVPGGGYPEGGLFGVDNSQTVNTLGVRFTSLEKSIVDLVKSLLAVGA